MDSFINVIVIRNINGRLVTIACLKNDNGFVLSTDDNDTGKRSTPEQREKLGLDQAPKKRGSRTPPPEPTNALQKVEVHTCAHTSSASYKIRSDGRYPSLKITLSRLGVK